MTSTNSYSKDGNANIVYKLSSVNSEDQPLMFMAAGKGTWKVTGKHWHWIFLNTRFQQTLIHLQQKSSVLVAKAI